ncbi:MAG: hypothetical protein RLZZ135_2075 [Cyanobacteriota bacterium]|jgi:hypothetical protein
MSITSSPDLRNPANFQLAIGSNVSHMLESNGYIRKSNQQFGLGNDLGDAVEFEVDRISSKSRDRIKSQIFIIERVNELGTICLKKQLIFSLTFEIE